ncbi:hypothetical protein ABOM_005702 [Aspergillus bombycis]|uniref:Uncharacterized protein n=1 Tax=Aspergillus bombycis TaxID=109264 RepID=A0A1F8A2Z9_9EURO|nr:hypothetical protein ABOM_005702 [Aspergillus bombycis]OGM46092.1 hypothetical protein ABOM_005702 [Aspergillus bombycis]
MFAWKIPENMPNLADSVRKFLNWNWHSSSQQNEPNRSDERSTQPLPTETLEMPGTATHPAGKPSPTTPEGPHGLNLVNGSEPFISTQNSSSASCHVEAMESLSHPHEDSPSVNSPLNPSQNETSKGANAGLSLLGRSKDPQEHQTVPDGPDAAHIAKILSTNNKLLSLQNKVAFKRSEVQELRTALRFKREEEADIRAQFIRHVTVAQGTPTSIQSLLQNNEALLSATGIYSDMEAEYNKAESELERDEYTLIRAMEDFARLSPGHHSLPTPNEPSLIDHDSLSDVRSTTSSAPEDPPDVADYVSCGTDGRDFVYELYPSAPPNQSEDPLKASMEEDISPFDPIEEKVSQNKFVNKWLLHRLRQSSVEIGHLKSLPEIKSLCDQGYDAEKVSQLSLKQWFEDEATVSPPLPPITSDMSVQEPGSVRGTASRSHSV